MIIGSELLNFKENSRDKSKIVILTVIFASICFSLMSAMVKYLSDLPLLEIIFFRSIPIMGILPLILKNKKIPFWGNNKPLLLLRSLISFVVIVIYHYSIKAIDLTDAVTIKQLSPFFAIILASILLGEKIFFKHIIIFVFAFLGTLLVIKPGFRLDIYPTIIGLLGAILTGGSQVAMRHLRLTDHPLIIVNYFGYTVGLLSFGALLWQGNFCIPAASNLFILVLMGLAGLGGQIALTKAYQMAPVNSISVYLYIQIIFIALLGILFFKEIPDLFSIFGMSLIIISGYLNYKLKEKEEVKI